MRAFVLSIIAAIALSACVPSGPQQVQRPLQTSAVQMDPGRVTTSQGPEGSVIVAVSGHGQHMFTVDQLCSYVDMFVNDSGTMPVGRSGTYLTINRQATGVNCGSLVAGGSGGSGQTYVSDLAVAVTSEDAPVTLTNEQEVPVGTTNTSGTAVTVIGGTGAYTAAPVQGQPAAQPPAVTVEAVDTTRPAEVTAGFGPVNK
jgi:hypothetical protein